MIGDVEHTILPHCLNNGLEIMLSRRDIFQENTVFDALAVRQRIAYTESVVEPRTKPILTDVLLVLDVIAILTTVLIGDADAEHIPNNITPIVKSAFGNIYSSANFITEPDFIQFFE